MIDLEQRPDLLLEAACDPSLVQCLGVGLGSSARALPQQYIREISFSPRVQSAMQDLGRPVSYAGFDGQPVTPDMVYASVVYGHGVLHTERDASFIVESAKIVRMSFYGRWFRDFGELTSLDKLVQRAGKPTRCLRVEANGDLLGFDCYYARSLKWLRWLDSNCRLSAVLLGAGPDLLTEGR